MIRILLLLFCTHQGGSSRTMMAIGDIHRRHLGKFLCDGLHILVVVNYPELMAETVDRRDEVVLWLRSGIAHDQLIQHGIVRIGKEYGFDVGIIHTDVLHAILFLVSASQLMLLDAASHIVIGMGTHHQTILRLAVHGLGINIIMFACVLNQPALVLELLEVLGGLLIHSGIILRCTHREIDLRLDNVIQTLLIVASLCPRLF